MRPFASVGIGDGDGDDVGRLLLLEHEGHGRVVVDAKGADAILVPSTLLVVAEVPQGLAEIVRLGRLTRLVVGKDAAFVN